MLGKRAVIFASVGSMLPFDRLVKAVDEWAGANPGQEVFLQIGDGAYEPRHAHWARIITNQDYKRRLEICDLFVAHVGMGSILQALQARKQMLLMPRQISLREHTTDHQLHTAGRFRDVRGLMIVDDEETLKVMMTRLLHDPLPASEGIPPFAPQAMIAKVASFLGTETT